MNNDHSFIDLLCKTIVALKDVLHSGVGAMMSYLYLYSHTKTFSLSMFVIYLIVGFFIGYIVGMFIPVETNYRDGILCLVGVGSYTFFGVIESKIVKRIEEKILKHL